MPTSYAEIMEALNRLEDTIYGDPSRDKKGVVEKVNNHESFIQEIRDIFRKILWAAVLGALGTAVNVWINSRSIAIQQQSAPQHSTQPK